MKKLRTHIEHGKDGNRLVADLYANESGFMVHINIEVEEVHVAHIEKQDNNLTLWSEIIA